MATTKSDIVKKKLVEALEKSLGIVTTACKSVDIARSTFYKWMEEDPEFKKSVSDIGEIALDFAESQLHKQIKEGSGAATIFYLKTKGKNRGYVERYEHDHTTQGDKIQTINLEIIEVKHQSE